MPKIIDPNAIASFLESVSLGADNITAARASGFNASCVSVWCKSRPGFAELLAQAREAGKVAKKRKRAENSRAMLSAILGRDAAPAVMAHCGPAPAAEAVAHSGPRLPPKRCPPGGQRLPPRRCRRWSSGTIVNRADGVQQGQRQTRPLRRRACASYRSGR